MIQSGSGLGEVRIVGTPGHNTRYRIECRILPILMLSYRHTSYMEHLEHQKTDTRLFLCLSSAKSLRELGRYQFCFMSPFIYILFVAVALAENQFTESLDADTRSQPTMDHPTSFISL